MDQELDLRALRRDYSQFELDHASLAENPFVQFKVWMNEAIQAAVDEPNAMTLATVTPEGRPDARIVLLKEMDERGFIFYTNYESAKARQMEAQPFAALVFNWLPLHRQIRISGRVEKVEPALSDRYFESRPLGSQIGALVSPQSQVIPDKSELEAAWSNRMETAERGIPVERPAYWGGYRLLPDQVEFWQGRSSRLHDRFRYSLGSGIWAIDRLAP